MHACSAAQADGQWVTSSALTTSCCCSDCTQERKASPLARGGTLSGEQAAGKASSAQQADAAQLRSD